MTLEQQFKEAKRTIPAGYKIVGWGNDKSLDYHGSDYAWDIDNGWEMAGSLGAEGFCSDWIYAKPIIHQQTDEECKTKAKKFFADIIFPKDEDILEEALRITGGDRMNDYGPPDQDFKRTAIMWEQLFNTRIVDGKLNLRPQDVASAMIAIKLSRQTHQGKRDNWTDIAGYARCGNLCEELESKEL